MTTAATSKVGRMRGWWCVLASLMPPACAGDGRGPTLEALDDQVAVVGTELVLALRASDPDGDEVDFTFRAPIEGIQDSARITRRPDGSGLFRWTPLADDLGTWFFDFTARDGDGEDTLTVLVDVRATAAGSAPVFREPLGSGTTLDLDQMPCLDLPVVVEDQDSPMVVLGQEAPLVEGAELHAASGLSATWSWCPNAAQLAEDRHPLVLTADDGANPIVRKNFLVVLRQGNKADCPGDAPAIVHSPRDEETVQDIEIVVDITDDLGLKNAPLLYHTAVEPKLPLDFADFDVTEMELVSGDMQVGQWRGLLPNPVAAQEPGAVAPLWYLVSATDNDDAVGECDHLTDHPVEGMHAITVTYVEGEGAAACTTCSADAQCGEAADLCATLAGGDTVCLTACETTADCDDGFACVSTSSVDGATASQCSPIAGACEDVRPRECDDDALEDNDTLAAAQGQPALGTGPHELMSCPQGAGDDEDWFRIVVATDTMVTLALEGGSSTDLDLALVGDDGTPLATSAGSGSDESIVQCVPAGTWFARVFTGDVGANAYELTYGAVASSCSAACEDDSLEPDDTFAQATYAEVYPEPYAVSGLQICSGDDDYFRVELFSGETLVVDLTFAQANAMEDIDLHFFSPAQVDLTPCTEANPATCTVAQGQSADSDEHFEYTVGQAGCSPCSFWVMVHGYGGSENDYDLELTLE
jgi:hypothetical protein